MRAFRVLKAPETLKPEPSSEFKAYKDVSSGSSYPGLRNVEDLGLSETPSPKTQTLNGNTLETFRL